MQIVVGLAEAGRSSINAKILRAQECTLESPWNTARYSLPTSYMSPIFNKWYPTRKMKETVSTERLTYQYAFLLIKWNAVPGQRVH